MLPTWSYIICGGLSAFAYEATVHFLPKKIKGILRVVICFVAAIVIGYLTTLIIASVLELN